MTPCLRHPGFPGRPAVAPGDLEVLRLTPDDWQVWRRLRLEALADSPDAFVSRLSDWQGDGDTEERWRNRLGSPGSRCFVCHRAGVPVGMVSADPDQDGRPVTWLQSMWVALDARGAGVVDVLVRAVVESARERGHDEVLLEVRVGNERAAAAYRRLGFVPTGRVHVVAGHPEETWRRSLAT